MTPISPSSIFSADTMFYEKGMKIISWNLLRRVGASVQDVAHIIEKERPDLLLMQEATHDIDRLPALVGGHYNRHPLPDRIHGVAYWSPLTLPAPPQILTLPRGALIRRVAQLVHCGPFAIANVHLSHGQLLNRRQLRKIGRFLPEHAAILGDFNIVGPDFLPTFQDVGPRRATHRMIKMVPFRLDRCLVRQMDCVTARVLPYEFSDHLPIEVTLRLPYK